MKRYIKILLLLILLLGIAWIIIGVVDSCQGDDLAKPPDVTKALYKVQVMANRNILYTNDYEKDGAEYLINGYWEQIKGKYRYRDSQLILSEYTFGEIKITVRSVNQ